MDELGGFKNSDQKYRFRKSITDLSKNESICDIHPLAKELIDNFNLDFEDALKETVLN